MEATDSCGKTVHVCVLKDNFGSMGDSLVSRGYKPETLHWEIISAVQDRTNKGSS